MQWRQTSDAGRPKVYIESGKNKKMDLNARQFEKTALISEEIFSYVSSYLDRITAQGTQFNKL